MIQAHSIQRRRSGLSSPPVPQQKHRRNDRHRQQQGASPLRTWLDGHIAATYYKIADGVITFIHTEVPPELGGKGVGSKLVKGALDQLRAEGLKVIAQCPFVKAYIEKHPDYADLLQ
jgi:hypothetical protein